MKDRYDRSSLVGDFMVMIDDQTEEEYLRRCPEGRFCEFIDGVRLHAIAGRALARPSSRIQFLVAP